ncbi:uncharacterized protein DNG_09356 [Cephalotrichum gorgonifer]|uniref:AHC1-like C2H2 zinc-finger domain-containing protein n=1 Tax=Cephalotrichum gorgonifer TaxID=2041049 RepID=A0AAE8N745_9PEZI|nr:uncharacterized protein DNG_09356 [Cephalotrichum gorgonifer]
MAGWGVLAANCFNLHDSESESLDVAGAQIEETAAWAWPGRAGLVYKLEHVSMLMFRFWGIDSRGAEQSVKLDRPMLHEFSRPLHPISQTISTSGAGVCAARPAWKRERDESYDEDAPVTKRPRPAPVDESTASAPPTAIAPPTAPVSPTPAASDQVKVSHLPDDRLQKAHDAIQFHFGLEILFKHDELRLIDQELAKCQIALEQLRRCHLIPYPVNCPTPDQMMDICSGKGPALRQPGKEVPRWAPPFGVADGPYARHYAKWLIPDPMFDGMLPEWQSPYDARGARTVAEGRTTRNSIGDAPLPGKQRPVRGNAGQKLQSLMSGYPAAKDKNGPCTLKRQSDGQTVKLVCLDCHRENFLSIQGFINHCRIAHRRDFKSHEEAAIRSGQPIDSTDAKAPAAPKPASEEVKPQPVATAPPPPSGLVHPFAQPELSRQQAFASLQSRIEESLQLYKQGKLPGVTCIPSSRKPTDTSPTSLVPSSDTPYLSRLMKAKKFDGNLEQLVGDAKTKVDFDEASSPSEDSEESVDRMCSATPTDAAPAMRMPARATMAPLQHPATTHTPNAKGLSPVLSFAEPLLGKHREPRDATARDEDEDMDHNLSPNPTASNNAPSLVSDDGEYDESDDGSSESDASDNLETRSMSDVADITMEEDGDAPRSLRHHGDSGTGTTVRFRKDDKKNHITFVSPSKI